MSDLDFPETSLAERTAIKVDGPDARPFLNRLLTSDIEILKDGEAIYTALLSPQGKILSDFFMFCAEDVFFLDCAASQITDLVKRLNLYKLRADVRISPVVNLEAFASPSDPNVDWGLKYLDPRSARIGWRAFIQKGSKSQVSGYHSARILDGLADTDADLGSGEFFPHEANLDQLGAVSFDKGCYVGQEVVSRMEHRATARSRILPVHLDGAAPAKGSEIVSGGKVVGTLLSSEGQDALALLRLDRLAEAKAPLLTAGVGTRVIKPRWARYDVPGARQGD